MLHHVVEHLFLPQIFVAIHSHDSQNNSSQFFSGNIKSVVLFPSYCILYCALGILSIVLSQIFNNMGKNGKSNHWSWCMFCGDCYKGGGFEELSLYLAINCRNGSSMQMCCCKVGSMFSTVAISVERYLAVAHPFAKFR